MSNKLNNIENFSMVTLLKLKDKKGQKTLKNNKENGYLLKFKVV